MGNRGAFDLLESVAREEIDREGQHENPAYTKVTGALQQCPDQPVPDALTLATRIHRDRPDLGKVLPHHVECSTADHHLVVGSFGIPEFLDVLVEGDGGLTQ